MKMLVYKFDVGSAIYWVAAPNLKSAIDCAFDHWRDEGLDSDLDSFEVELDPDPSKVTISEISSIDARYATSCTLLDLAKDLAKPQMLGCSEW